MRLEWPAEVQCLFPSHPVDISFFQPPQPAHNHNIYRNYLLHSAIRLVLHLRALVGVFLYLLRFGRCFLHLFVEVADLTRLRSGLLNSIYLNPAQCSYGSIA